MTNNKYIAQLVDKAGKPIAAATSAPGCFIHDGVGLKHHKDLSWGRSFAQPTSGNQVEFYVTGDEYFSAVASAICGAKKSICITGWQVNFDVELTSGKTLFHYLEQALDAHPALHIYVMPWLSPKVGVDTGDFDTMLAIFQLNAGLKTPMRAFALPAIAQSDMGGALNIGFSHHQKLVVIDDQRAFVGGIDLAYGRRDDGRFSLAANGRTGNELYNSCIPAMHELTNVEQTKYLTRAELFCACFDGTLGGLGTFVSSAPMKPIAAVQDALGAVSDAIKDTNKQFEDWWNTVNIAPDFVRSLQAMPVDAAQDLSRWAFRQLDQPMREKLERLRQTGSAHAANAAAVLLAWLNNASLDQLPAELRAASSQVIEAFVLVSLGHLSQAAGARKQRYPNLRKLGKMLPASGKVISSTQPRMPWHDVQASITGPAVSDLSRNFVLRWNGLIQRYKTSQAKLTNGAQARAFFAAFGLKPFPGLRLPKLPAPLPCKDQPKTGQAWVQVLRSAPCCMQNDEAAAAPAAAKGSAITHRQNDCLKAMLTAIHGAQKFIYIEGQFFQSAYGLSDNEDKKPSGPMAALIDITASPGYKTYAKRLGIEGVEPKNLATAIRWSQANAIRIEAQGSAFMNDLAAVLKNIASIESSKILGTAQKAIYSPIGEALATRIEDAIFDGKPFHVYLVLPVHPEGTLDTLNIMTQLHLTMQSLVFGSNSLINRVRRAIVAAPLRKARGISRSEAMSIVGKYPLVKVIDDAGEKWREYLTLLNLRSWELLGNRPVTEQIYVHSKLLIADDRVAVLGSANINDRSQLGDRDSELVVILRDDVPIQVKLDGVHDASVSASIHQLRTRLWEKLFGLMGSAVAASDLANVIDKPAAKQTWEAIGRVARANALAFNKAFAFLPAEGKRNVIWPAWNATEGKLGYHMPFDPRFWRENKALDAALSRDARARALETMPSGIQGFIVELPIFWTKAENNLAPMNLTLLASLEQGNLDKYRV